jgi:hypothetical protein
MAEKKRSKPNDPKDPEVPRKAPPPGKRYFLATMDAKLIKELKQAAIGLDKSASQCLEDATAEWLERQARAKKD